MAAEEHRQNFSLTNTNSAGSKAIYLPGVHSDIGAGYTDNYKEELIVYKGSKNGALAEENRLTEITGWCKASQLELIEPPKYRGVVSKGVIS